jgi:hypothetical protein
MLMIFQNSSARDNKMSSRIKYISAYYTFFRGLSAYYLVFNFEDTLLSPFGNIHNYSNNFICRI